MGWNGSGGGSTPVKPRVTAKKPSPVRGVIAGLVVVAVVCVAYFAFFSGNEGNEKVPEKVEKKPTAIKEVKPAAAPTNRVAEVKKPSKPKELPPQRVGEVRNGYRLLPNGRMHRVVGVVTCEVARVSLAERIFDEPSDQNIASLMMIQPGDGLLGSSEDYYEGFNETFLESLKTPIIITKDDTEEIKELKQAVIDARKELRDRLDAGEDLTKIMRESREQMRELGLYRDEIEEQVKNIIVEKGDLTKQDLKDLVDAANKMLEDRGANPIEINAAFAHQIRRARMKELEQNESKDK